MCKFFPLLLFIFSSQFAFADDSDSINDNVQPKQLLEIRYESPAWNKNPNKAETYPVIARDSDSGKALLVNLTETSENSGIFVGSFRFDFGTSGVDYSLEIFIPPHNTTAFSQQELHKLLKQDILPKKFFFAYQEKNVAHIQLYDTNEQVHDAYRQRDLMLSQQTHMSNTTLANFAEDENAKALDEAKQKSAIEAQERKNLEDKEQERLIRLLQEQAALTNKAREERRVEALVTSRHALAAYTKENFDEASKLFESAYTLDPENSTYMYQYGVCLYKLGQYNKSLSVLDLANDPAVNVTEKQYYRGLALMKLKDFDRAWAEFNSAKLARSRTYSPPAAFFAGIIDFQTENFDRAKDEFEFVLNYSKDAKMDKQAESYLDQVINASNFLQKRSKPWSVAASGGMLYDSNILNLANGNSATNQDGLRANYQVSAEYRLSYQQDHEWTAYFGGSDMYSMTTAFATNSSIQSQDPLQAFLYVPYRWRGKLLGTSGQLSFATGYEMINMDPYQTGSRNPILNSWVERMDWTYLARETHLVNHELELRRDISLLPSDSNDTLSAYKATYLWTNTFFQDHKKESAWVYDFLLADNAGDGINFAYQQVGLAATYVTPWKWQSTVSGKLGLSYSAYPQNLSSRTDVDGNFTGGFRKPLTRTLAVVLSASYLVNNSTLAAYAYSKYTLGASLAWVTDL